MQDLLKTTALPSRIVLFMTQGLAADVPGHDKALACLLPLGTASFAERVMDSCALAGVRQIDVVVSEHPEALRSILQDGLPWGIRLNWHHAKESAIPYTVLRGMGLSAHENVVIGHAHQWVDSTIVHGLMQTSGVAVHVSNDVVWTGWFSAAGTVVSELGPHEDYSSMEARVRSMQGARCLIASPTAFAKNLCGADLLAAQHNALNGLQESSIPASWLRMPWGAASPDAVIHADAEIQGPVLIGARCVVEAGAELGPSTVLANDVFVAGGARVRHSVVMANTYVGGQIALENVLAQGNSVHSLKWSVRTDLSAADAMMAPLRIQSRRTTPWFSRVLACVMALMVSPLWLACFLVQRIHGARAPWRSVRAVKSNARGAHRLIHLTVRQPHSQRPLDRWVAHFGALLDIVQGRRAWFGLRPRIESEWYALGRDWQDLFSRTAIGLLHAPAWSENGESTECETYAAADAYMAVQSSAFGRAKILYAYAWRNRVAGSRLSRAG